jgi:hypothetical protein
MRFKRKNGCLNSGMFGAHYKRAIDIIVFTPSVDRIPQNRNKQQNNCEKGSIVQRQAQADRHDLSLLFTQHIASATNGVYQSRLSLSFEFLAELLYIDFDHIPIPSKVIAPDTVE